MPHSGFSPPSFSVWNWVPSRRPCFHSLSISLSPIFSLQIPLPFLGEARKTVTYTRLLEKTSEGQGTERPETCRWQSPMPPQMGSNHAAYDVVPQRAARRALVRVFSRPVSYARETTDLLGVFFGRPWETEAPCSAFMFSPTRCGHVCDTHAYRTPRACRVLPGLVLFPAAVSLPGVFFANAFRPSPLPAFRPLFFFILARAFLSPFALSASLSLSLPLFARLVGLKKYV